jgi:hypothetical protein
MAGLLYSTPMQVPTAAPTLPSVAQAGASTYQSRDANVVNATSTGYDPTATTVGRNSTVAGQVEDITKSGSPLMQLAQTQATAAANRRGLLNSSIAVGAGQKALYESALPIAQQDANTNFSAESQTSGAKNTASQFGAAAQNTASLQNSSLGTQVNVSNATEANKAASQNAQSATQVSMANANALNQQGSQVLQGQQAIQQIGAQGGVQERLQQIQSNTQLSIADKQIAANKVLADNDNALKDRLAKLQADTTLAAADKQTQSQQLIAQHNNETNLAIAGNDNQTKQLLQSMDAASKLSLANIDAGTKLAVAGLDAATKEKLTNLESDNRQILQTSINAANSYAQYATNLANISLNDKLDGPAKQQAADNQLNALNAALKSYGAVSGLDLSQYFQPATITQPSSSGVGATNPGATPTDYQRNEG